MSENREIRAGRAPQVRAEGDGVSIEGHAAVFNQETVIGDWFREVVSPGAFTEAVLRDDVVLLVNHAGLPLARTSSGTLALEEDGTGLRTVATLEASDPDVQALVPKLERGDLSHMSFAFWVTREEWDETGDTPLRTIREVTLDDVSIVNRPAYLGTDVGLRSLEAYRRRQERQKNFAAASLRRRLRMDLQLRTR